MRRSQQLRSFRLQIKYGPANKDRAAFLFCRYFITSLLLYFASQNRNEYPTCTDCVPTFTVLSSYSPDNNPLVPTCSVAVG